MKSKNTNGKHKFCHKNLQFYRIIEKSSGRILQGGIQGPLCRPIIIDQELEVFKEISEEQFDRDIRKSFKDFMRNKMMEQFN